MDLLDLSIDLNSVEPSSSSSITPKAPTNRRRSSIRSKVTAAAESPSVSKESQPDVIGSGKRQRIKNTRRFSPSPEVTKKMRPSNMTPAAPLKAPKLSEFGMTLRALESRNKPIDYIAPKFKNMSAKTQKIEEEIRKKQMANTNQISSKSPTRTSQRKQPTNNKSADLPSQSPPSSVDFVDEKTEKSAFNIQEEAVDKAEAAKKPPKSRKSAASKVVQEVIEENSSEKSTEQKNDEPAKEPTRRSSRKSIVSEKVENVKNGESSIRSRRSSRRSVTSVEPVRNDAKTDESAQTLEKQSSEEPENEEKVTSEIPEDPEKDIKEEPEEDVKEEPEDIASEEPEKPEVTDVPQEKIEKSRRRSSMKTFKEPATPVDESQKSTSKSVTESSKPASSPYSAYAIRRRIAPKSSERRSLTRKSAVEVQAKEVVVSVESTSNSESKESSVEAEKEPEEKKEEKEVEAEKVENVIEPKIEDEVKEEIPATVEPAETAKTVDPVVPPTNVQLPKPTSTPSTSTHAVRSSSRRSKPNRMYQEDFDVDPSYQKVLSSTIRRNNQGEEPPVLSSVLLQEPSSSFSPIVAVAKPAPPPKSEFRYGCQRGYIPSKKEYIMGTVLENGKEESVNALVLSVLDKLMLDVCLDGVRKHSDISLDYRKTKIGRKEEEAEKRKIKEAIRKAKNPAPKSKSISVPSSSMMLTIDTEESTKRKRIPTRPSDDYMYDYSSQKSASADDKKMEERRNFLAEEFNLEMEQQILAEREREREKIEAKRKKKDRPKISLEEYMVQRDVKNRPDCGIKLYEDPKESANNDNEDYFYHELLSDYPSTSSVRTGTDYDADGREDEEEEQIDIGQPESLDSAQLIESHVNLLLKCHGESLAAADAIEKILSRPTNQDGSNYTLVNVMERAASEQTEKNMRILMVVIDIINSQYLLETTPSARTYNIESSLYNSTNLNAQKLKNTYTMFDIPQQDAVIWVHTFLVEHLPVHFLASYLVLLKHAKSMTCSYIGRIVKQTYKESHEWIQINSIIASHVSAKLRDPEEKYLEQTIHRNSMPDVVFLLVSPMMSIGEFWNKPRAHEMLFRWMKMIGHPDSEIVKTTLEQDYTTSVAEFMCENLTETICEKVRQKYRENENCRIVLVGYGWTTYAVHHIANLVNGISAIISLGFPVMCEYGRRGIPDDDILLTYCPTLFVTGAEGEYYDNVAMKDLRSSMINHNGLVIIGHANDQLLVPTNVLVRLGVTQKVVFRLILEKIVSFLKLEETKWERTKLFPVPLNNIVQIDASILKAGEKAAAAAASQLTPQPNNSSSLSMLASPKFPTSPPMASPVGAAGRRNTVASTVNHVVDDFPRQMAQPILPKKKKTEHSQLASPASTEARLKFNETLMKRVQMPESHRVVTDFSTTSQFKPTDIRERSLTLPTTTPIPSSSNRPRMNLIPPSRFVGGRHPSSSLSSPVTRPPSSQPAQKKETTSTGLIDPASISLQ